MKSKTSKAFLYYIGFFWGVTWRTMVVAMISALIISIALGYLSAKNNWPPELLTQMATFSGIPVAVLALLYTFIRRGFVLKTQIVDLYN